MHQRSTPQLFTPQEIRKNTVQSRGRDKIWRPARYLKCNIRFARIRLALGVLCGRFDALDWEENK